MGLIRKGSKVLDMSLPDILVSGSTLTPKQLESLRSYVRFKRGEMRLKDAASQRSGRAVTIQSYYRTVQQGRGKIRESLTTVVIGLWLGLIKLEDARRLLEFAGKGGGEPSGEEVLHLCRVLQALVEKVVM